MPKETFFRVMLCVLNENFKHANVQAVFCELSCALHAFESHQLHVAIYPCLQTLDQKCGVSGGKSRMREKGDPGSTLRRQTSGQHYCA